ncbi:Histidine kinase [Chitinophaga terrae (ex Kim and Jung 2007)]|uniref:Histidine kinase n=1 Tax=Chitinophaga terrae (ex Kim and Jung 2007) TaxID=408074 RepID=A0A1H3ZYF4_9BACT|nr:Histidine kinase [Chitinophaga terrae (ex Kim and Jung 2007)]
MPPLKQIIRSRPFVISLHVLGWACFLFFPFFIYRIQILHTGFFIKELIDNLFLIGVFYLNIYVLIPRFFNGKKIVTYFALMIGVLLFITFQQATLDYYFFKNVSRRAPFIALRLDKKNHDGLVTERVFPPFHIRRFDTIGVQAVPAIPATLHGKPVPPAFSRMGVTLSAGEEPKLLQYLFFPEVLRRSGFFALLMLFMSGFIKIAMEWFKSEKQREELKVEKLNAELKFLKSQINPHFLFNCLNTIYSLAHKQSTQTEHAILKLSTIMRYMIYESNEDKVLLSQELKYLQDYIDIQRLRLPKDINIDYRMSGFPGSLRIEPMLLVPFVENAFKHGISYTEDAFIDINIDIVDETLNLEVRNSHFKERVAEKGGIGLQNVLKRLDMLYSNEHTIDIKEMESQFIVDLKIALKK